jgi:hypothetical protein
MHLHGRCKRLTGAGLTVSEGERGDHFRDWLKYRKSGGG